jgi:hypothetical protein
LKFGDRKNFSDEAFFAIGEDGAEENVVLLEYFINNGSLQPWF